MLKSDVLYTSEKQNHALEVAPEGYGYRFQVIRPDGQTVEFVLSGWQRAHETVSWLEQNKYRVKVVAA